jgi:hypothetical protein
MAQDIVGSNMPDFASDALKVPKPKRGYGQNGFNGASSDLPGERTTSGFLPDCDLSAAIAQDTPSDPSRQTLNGKGNPPTPRSKPTLSGPQARKISANQYPTAFGTRKRGQNDGSPG